MRAGPLESQKLIILALFAIKLCIKKTQPWRTQTNISLPQNASYSHLVSNYILIIMVIFNDQFVSLLLLNITKGQLISKELVGILNSFKK